MSTRRRPVFRALLPLVAIVGLGGCGSILPQKEPMEILDPQVKVAPDPSWPQVTWQLGIGRPNAGDAIDSRRMAVVPMPGRIQVYKGVSWSDAVPEIVQSSLIAAFQDSGRILAVGSPTSGLHSDFALSIDLRDYQAVYRTPASPPDIVVELNARLVRNDGGRVVASRTFRASVTASSTEVHAVAHAFDQALATVEHDLVGWTLTSGEQARLTDTKATSIR